MNEYLYQRQVVAYHGCDQAVADHVLLNGDLLTHSQNSYDWLGEGIYFWEHGPQRAFEWAEQSSSVKKPAVIGALLQLGNCFDLLDIRYTEALQRTWPIFLEVLQANGEQLPHNMDPKKDQSGEKVLRYRDCAMIDFTINFLEESNPHQKPYDSVRGLFQEGDAAFEGSAIRMKSHIQISIRNPACIIGYFKPVFPK